MRESPFLDLGDKFTTCRTLTSPNEARSLERTMAEAGRSLFHVLAEKLILLDAPPAWFSECPEESLYTENHRKEVVEVLEPRWSMYWWSAVVWFHHERPDTGIVMPAGRLGRLESPPLWCDFGSGPLIDALPRRYEREAEVDLWKQVASASADACVFFARALAEQSAEDLMPAKYFEQFGIPDDRLRQAKQHGKISVQASPDSRNRYSVREVRSLWPECFEEPGAGPA